MKIDKSKLDALAALPDEELWKKIREVADGKGITLPKEEPSKSDLLALRSILTGGEKLNMMAAARLIRDLKRGADNERK